MNFVWVWLLSACAAWAAPPMVSQSFEQDDAGWVAMGGEGKIQITHDPALVKNGKGAMEFRYEASGTKPALAVTPVVKPITAMKSLSFWIMADAQTVAGVALVEKGGGRYAANFWLEANTWQRVEVTPEDFVLASGPNDPKDPDGKLDLDQVEAVGILDVSQVIAAASGGGEAKARIAVEEHTGTHKLWLDDFEISGALPEGAGARSAFVVDDYREPQVNWITMGGANLKVDSSGTVLKGRSLRIDSSEMPERFVLAARMLPSMDLRGATHLAFDIAAEKPAHLILSIQEKSEGPDGPRYNADVEVPGGNQSAHRELEFSAFQIDDNGPADADHKLDLDQLRSFSMVDVTGAYTGEESVNTIRIGKIVAVTHK